MDALQRVFVCTQMHLLSLVKSLSLMNTFQRTIARISPIFVFCDTVYIWQYRYITKKVAQ